MKTVSASRSRDNRPAPQNERIDTVDQTATSLRLESQEGVASSGPLYGHNFGAMRVLSNQTSAPPSAAAGGGAAALLRSGQSIPGGAQLENVDTDSARIIDHVAQVAGSADSGFASNVNWRRRIGPQVEMAVAGMLSQRSIPIDFVEDSGLNIHWFGSITFRMGTPQPIAGGGTGNVTHNYGGSGAVANTSATANTDGATASGTVTNAPPSATGGTTVGGTAGVNTSTARTDTNSSTATVNAGGASTTASALERYQAPLIVSVDLTSEADMSGSDYVNPLKWGMALGDAISRHHASGEASIGSIQYFRSNGIAPTAPAQRRSWLEHELGISDDDTRNAARVDELNAINPAEFSRAGAQPLSGLMEDVTHQHLGMSLNGVRLIHGAQADAYTQQLEAAAFTTPNELGGSDIFMRSDVNLGSLGGQHTLHHEIAHAAQNARGETGQLQGLGGDAFQRHALETDANQRADAIMQTIAPATRGPSAAPPTP